ncbi:MAG TPA: translation initiation factor IF-3 [Candidatus Limnocylindrales bacterium]|nr:translation initiation factor IF-3 [Candidatus Limnocylindrales bacterium]
MNEQISAREVLVIDADGTQLGVLKTDEALRLAREKKMDLVNVAPGARPPVCRLMDYGKFKYEQSKRDREARKKQSVSIMKEIKLRPNIDKHDFEVKARHTQKFLENGDKVKITVMFRGREVTHPEIALRLCEQLAKNMAVFGVVEKPAKQEGRNMIMILSPKSQ